MVSQSNSEFLYKYFYTNNEIFWNFIFIYKELNQYHDYNYTQC